MIQFLCITLLIATVKSTSEPQREDVLFEKADANLSDNLDLSEFDLVLSNFDTDGDKIVTLSEFINDWTTRFNLGNAAEARSLFDEADSNDDGRLEHTDIVNFFHFFDMDNNGVVDRNEFLTQWGELKLVPVGSAAPLSGGSTADPSVFG